VDSVAQPSDVKSDQSLIPDLRGIGLAQLAGRAAAGEKDVTGVVSRILDGQESSSRVQAMTFNSSI
jgi:hypothetical protein